MKKILIVIGALAVIGAAIGGALYLALPVQMSTIGGLMRNYVLSIGAPPGTATTELNAAYQAPPSPSPDAPVSNASTGDWPSYNRTVTSDRFSPLREINTANVGGLKVLCTYDVGGYVAFESG